jgi:hypothetical protein
MAAGDAYITCLNNEAGAEALLKMVAVDSSGNLYIDCDNEELSIADIINLLIVEDASGNPALSVALTGGGGGHMEFTTILNQVAFDTTGTLTLTAMYKVFVDGIFQSWGHTRVGNVVTFAVPFAAGHEVSIQL